LTTLAKAKTMTINSAGITQDNHHLTIVKCFRVQAVEVEQQSYQPRYNQQPESIKANKAYYNT